MNRRVHAPAQGELFGILTAGPLRAGASARQGQSRRVRSRARTLLLPVGVLVVVLLAPLAALLVCVHLLGWQLQVIQTGSMAPRYPEGSLAIIEPVDPADVKIGMTIVFDDPLAPGRVVAHRVVDKVEGTNTWQTKGDANASRDPIPVQAAAIRGRVRWAVPGVGRWIDSVRGPTGLIVLVGVPLALLLVTELTDWRRRRSGGCSR